MRFQPLSRATILGLTLAAAAALTACGSSDPATTKVASSNVQTTLDAATGTKQLPALQSVSTGFSFSNGVTDFGTTAATTVKISGTTAAPAFSIGAGTQSASGDFGFGSCKFTVKSTTFTSGPLSAVGSTITITPCNFNITTSGQSANGEAQNRPTELVLGTTKGTATISVIVRPDGGVVAGGQEVGTTPTNTTGAK